MSRGAAPCSRTSPPPPAPPRRPPAPAPGLHARGRSRSPEELPGQSGSSLRCPHRCQSAASRHHLLRSCTSRSAHRSRGLRPSTVSTIPTTPLSLLSCTSTPDQKKSIPLLYFDFVFIEMQYPDDDWAPPLFYRRFSSKRALKTNGRRPRCSLFSFLFMVGDEETA